MAWTTPTSRATGFLVTASVYDNEIINNLLYLHGDGGATIDLTAGGQALRTSALQLGAGDTSLSRVVAGQVELAGTAGLGNLLSGFASFNVAGGGTLTPDAARLVERCNITSTGTVTFAPPANTVPANFSTLKIILVQNGSGGAVTLSWNAAYTGNLAAGPGAGQGVYQVLVWDGSTSKWVGIVTGSVPTGL